MSHRLTSAAVMHLALSLMEQYALEHRGATLDMRTEMEDAGDLSSIILHQVYDQPPEDEQYAEFHEDEMYELNGTRRWKLYCTEELMGYLDKNPAATRRIALIPVNIDGQPLHGS